MQWACVLYNTIFFCSVQWMLTMMILNNLSKSKWAQLHTMEVSLLRRCVQLGSKREGRSGRRRQENPVSIRHKHLGEYFHHPTHQLRLFTGPVARKPGKNSKLEESTLQLQDMLFLELFLVSWDKQPFSPSASLAGVLVVFYNTIVCYTDTLIASWVMEAVERCT